MIFYHRILATFSNKECLLKMENLTNNQSNALTKFLFQFYLQLKNLNKTRIYLISIQRIAQTLMDNKSILPLKTPGPKRLMIFPFMSLSKSN